MRELDTTLDAWTEALVSKTERRIITSLHVDSHIYVAERVKYGNSRFGEWMLTIKIDGVELPDVIGRFRTITDAVRHVETSEAKRFVERARGEQ